MMGKTHVAMGMAVALLVLHPVNSRECIAAIAGGVLGGTAADIDAVKDDYKHDALKGQLIAFGTAVVSLLTDYFTQTGVMDAAVRHDRILLIIGAVVYLALMLTGYFSGHRAFTHSFLAMALFSAAMYLIFPPVTIAYVVGYASHLLLDLMNKKDLPLFFPGRKGFCLKWCYADRTANNVFFCIGLIVSAVMISNAVGRRFW